MQQQLYILTSDEAYEGSFYHYQTLFLYKENAERAYEECVQKALKDYTEVGTTPPTDVTNKNRDDISALKGEYVFTRNESNKIGIKLTLIYQAGNYSTNHVEICLKKIDIKDYDGKNQ